ncbi:CPBP family intramembrane metalloprotease [Stigmatella sp. ncwal1]|uniref:CPBP family intramembrane metalloprotease n=1 Tax=Stigmatella ashevillensis TaxID=2995309 RepID=A0ABT5D8T6_9BACT|nr:CPBP family intramembrane glutamic endopeptidase [Stigmatella ashevillena]MDC0710095.1 CPBP family intramembrane metalloprotease [Stigmatella ashevillena]
MGESSTHVKWTVMASVAALAWAVLVRVRPEGFYLVGPVYCLAWGGLSWKALGSPRRLPRSMGREVLWGAAVGAAMVGVSLAVAWGGCAGASWPLCQPVETLTGQARELSAAALAGVGLLVVPAEEVFWHGVVQTALRPKVGPLLRAVLSTGLLCLSYLLVGAWELALVALPTFLVWGGMTEWRQTLVAPVVSHGLWTVMMIALLG